jgi:phosphoribosylpyrophosphate synthetase
VDWGTFGDGWPNLFIHQVKDARYNDVAFLACLDSPATWLAQVSVMMCLPRYAARSLHVVIPYFQGTMERVDTPGQVATTATQAHILSNIPPAVVGPPQITLLDMHNLTTTHYFGPGVHVRPKSLVPLLLNELFALPDTANVSIAFPDEGAFKRFSPKFVHLFPTIVCKKRRLPNGERRVEIHDGAEHVAGRHVVIVDDLVQSGGTLLRCAEALQAQKAGTISAYVSHGVFPKDSWKKFLREEAPPSGGASASASAPGAGLTVSASAQALEAVGGDSTAFKHPPVIFEHFWLTDSIPGTAAAVAGRAPFTVLQCAGMVWDAILQYKQCLHGAAV